MKKNALVAEQGYILIITLVMLLMASVIGIMAVTTSTTEVAMSGNFKTGLQTFYTTDAVAQYVLSEPTTFDMTRYAAPLATVNVADPTIAGSANVTYLASGLPPPGTSAKFFSTNYFVISATSNGPANAQDTQVVQWAQIVPKS
jgi:hypothetical protein